MMKGTRIMRFIGNRPVPEPNLFDSLFLDPINYVMGVDWGQSTPKSMSLADLREFSKTCPNPLDSDFDSVAKIAIPGNLFVSNRSEKSMMDMSIQQTYAHLSGIGFWPTYPGVVEEKEPEEKPDQEQFEVNLTEPLVGWRKWCIRERVLQSYNHQTPWRPCEVFVAVCYNMRARAHHKDLVPTEDCPCGVYGVDHQSDLPVDEGSPFFNDGEVVAGLVYGWGRYVRGGRGWRCQFAYPKEFHLRSFQAHLIEPLRAFRVPILIDEPVRIYDPQEDGYENGNWSEETNRDLRAASDSNPEED